MTRTFRVLVPSAVLTVLLALPVSAAPLAFPIPPLQGLPQGGRVPAVTAPSWILFDESTDIVLGSLNPTDSLAMASITKIMTGLIAVENTRPADLVSISETAAATGEKEIDLVAGETLTMDALFKSLMIHSANDSATAIVEHVGGSVDGFVALMNERAAELGLTETSFRNPHGLDAPNHHSSALDMLNLVRAAMESQYFADVVRSTIVVIPPAPDGTERIGTSTNLLLTGGDSRPGAPAVDPYPGSIGVKTGFTSQAQRTYVASVERDQRRLYAVIFGADEPRSHFFDAERLFDYGFGQFPYSGPIALGTPYVSTMARIEPDPLLVQGDVETYIHLAGQGLTLEAPLPVIESAEVEPIPIPTTEVSRSPETGPTSIVDTITFWFDRLFNA